MNRAYSLLTIKEIDEERRVLTGLASTPTTDRMGDIVEPKGAKFKLPLPLLWQHNSRQPIGHVTKARVTEDGIEVVAQIAKGVVPYIDEAWALIKAGLVRGFSIGFRELESAEIKDSWGIHFQKWEWLELSAVTIPANSDASIQTIKSIDEAQRAASGRRSVVLSPGASGPTVTPKGKTMKTIKERIADFQAARMAKAAQLQELLNKQDGGATLDAAEQETFDTLDGEITEIDGHLKRLERAEALNASAAVAVNKDAAASVPANLPAPSRPGSGIISVRSNLEPGIMFARYAQAQVRGNFNPNAVVQAIEADRVWMRSTPELAMIAKTAIPAADTTTTGWASEWVYAQNMASEFIEYLRPMTVIGRIPNFRRVPFNIRVAGMSAGTTGYWVGQGLPIPVSKGTSTSTTLGITKAAGISSITKELARLSTPSAELMIRDDLAKAVVATIDDAFINPNNGGIANEKPASMLYGVTPITPTGTTYAFMRADLQSLMEVSFDANLDTSGSVWIMSHSTALKLAMMVNALDQRVNPDMTANGGTFQGYPVIVSQMLQISGSPQYNDIIIFLHPREVFMADDGQVTLESSDQVSLQLLDNPTNQSTSGTVATTMISMFQTESIAIKAVRYINWAKRRTQAAQWIQAAAYVG